MERTMFISIIEKFKAAGITSFGTFCRGGNYELRHNGVDTFVVCANDYVVHLRYNDTCGDLSSKNIFEVDIIPWENIDYIFPIGMDYKSTKDLLIDLGVMNDEISNFLNKSSIKYAINNSSRNMRENDPFKNKEFLPSRSAYIIERPDNTIQQ